MKDNIRVSVICMVFNHKPYLRQCLDSLVSQKTNFKYEIIINDDASTDGSSDIIREYADKYPNLIVPFIREKNLYSQGLSAAPEIYTRAKGEFCAICEGDDYWCDENKLQLQYDVMMAHPECSICVHKVENVNEDGSSQNTFFPEKNLQEGVISGRETLSKFPYYWFHTTSYFTRRENCRKIHIDLVDIKKTCPVGDVLTTYMNACWGDVYYIDRTMSCYRRASQGSWSNKMNSDTEYRKKHDQRMIAFIDKFYDFAVETVADKACPLEQIKNAKNYFEFRICLSDKNYRAALKKKYRPILKTLSKKERVNLTIKGILNR